MVVSHPAHAWARFLTAQAGFLVHFLTLCITDQFKNPVEQFINQSKVWNPAVTYISQIYLEMIWIKFCTRLTTKWLPKETIYNTDKISSVDVNMCLTFQHERVDNVVIQQLKVFMANP